MSKDSIVLAQELIKCPSVTPEDNGALVYLQKVLSSLGFECHSLRFSEEGTASVDNLYARYGRKGRVFGYAGHTDVVPTGVNWRYPPFSATIADGKLWGRGSVDMKGSIAAFVAAIQRFLDTYGSIFDESIALVITGDEEGVAVNGTVKILDWMTQNNEKLDVCIVGEPTNSEFLGDTIKAGRRGSMDCVLRVKGIQGHAAYPELADNPISRLIGLLNKLVSLKLDEGTDLFQPSTLTVTNIHVGNTATNVIPEWANASFNIRFNDLHNFDSLKALLHKTLDDTQLGNYDLTLRSNSEAFVTTAPAFLKVVSSAVQEVTNYVPNLTTGGGTSDARFIKNMCPVVEFGLVNKSMHKVDEFSPLEDIRQLTDVYFVMLKKYFDS